MTDNRKPHRQFCSVCHEVDRVMFDVPDEIWESATHHSQRDNIICLACFTKMADERGVEWDKDIKFYPVSQIAQDRIVQRATQRVTREILSMGGTSTHLNSEGVPDKKVPT